MTAPSLSPERHTELAEALHADVDGDFLVAASGFGEDIALNQAGIADVVRWALNAASPLVARWLAEAEHQALVDAAFDAQQVASEAEATYRESYRPYDQGVSDAWDAAADGLVSRAASRRAALVPGHDHEGGK